MAAWKIAPALATGNTVVLKPADSTPLTALVFARSFVRKLDCPAGVVKHRDWRMASTGEALVKHSDVDKIAFTGLDRGRTRRFAAPPPQLRNAYRWSWEGRIALHHFR